MLIKTLTVGPLETNCYVVADEAARLCAVIDPGGDAAVILDYLERAGLSCQAILLTHGHFDHTGGVADLLADTDAALFMHPSDNGAYANGGLYPFAAPAGTKFFTEGDVITVGALRFTVLETPGHTPGSVTFLCSHGDDSVLFTGDTLFRDSCGRTDFPDSSGEAMLRSLKRLAALKGDYEVYPGHGFATSLDRERSVNYFLGAALRS